MSQGLGAFLMSLLPLLLDLLDLPEPVVWRAASVAAALIIGVTHGHTVWTSHSLTKLGHPPQAPWLLRAGLSLGALAVATTVCNAVGWPQAPGPFPYGLAVTLSLTGAVLGLLLSFLIPLQELSAGGKKGG